LIAWCAHIEPTLTIEPPPFRFMFLATACVTKWGDRFSVM
jgi:hypothetical protein